MRRFNLTLILVVLALISCSNDDDQPTPQPSFEPTEIEFANIGMGMMFSGGSEGIPESNIVINTNEVWQALLDSIGPQGDLFISDAEVDFTDYTVLAVFLDVKPTTWFVEITSIVRYEDRIEVQMIDGDGDDTQITQPTIL